MLYVTIRTKLEDWAKGIDWTNNSLTILEIKPSIGGFKALVKFKGEEETIGKLGWKLSRISRYYLGTIVLNGDEERILSKYIVMRGNVSSEGIFWTVVLVDYLELKNMLKELFESSLEVKVLKVIKARGQDALTARQEQILRIAFDAGYYDYPKRIRLKELAEKLNLSVASLTEILRRAEKNVISTFFRERGI
ncbi:MULTISPECIES: helix-turn-helix domain-containing protein [Acidianus]|uniref:Bacterio-opsin activator n=1 Tax=Candidatus Acidianus copahuensis TaxID=1160895 RepID=A0A031LK32_9CREN|nr:MULTISPECIES: helix-turn-helix domain-containing protein [Acidianus]EZQ01896.1 bacterio-opsin activator [Candidatus Acidianus copahuensis]NON61946.1 bacterio-opsin activator [Acidianus sp. RZ1]